MYSDYIFLSKLLRTARIESSLKCYDCWVCFLLYILWRESYILALRALYYGVIDSNNVLVPDNESKVDSLPLYTTLIYFMSMVTRYYCNK